MAAKQNIAKRIIDEIRENQYITKSKLITNVSKKTNVGSTTVRDVLSQMIGLKILTKRTVGKAQVHTVNDEKIDEIKKIVD
jgi:predicted transcriptional regulator